MLDQATTIALLNGRNQRALLQFYVQIIGDYDKVVNLYLSDNKFAEIIQLLNDAPFERVEMLLYKTAPILVEFAPEITFNLIMNRSSMVQFKHVLPTLLRYTEVLDRFIASKRNVLLSATSRLSMENSMCLNPDDDEEEAHLGSNLNTDFEGRTVNFAVHFMENYVQRLEMESHQEVDLKLVYHMYFWLLMKYDNVREDALTALLRPWVDSVVTENAPDIPALREVELSYALRLAKKYRRKKSCVYLYVLMQLPQQAVATALTVDIEMAKTIASYPTDSMVRKKLWMLIAQHILRADAHTSHEQQTANVKHALSLITISDGILSIGVRNLMFCNLH